MTEESIFTQALAIDDPAGRQAYLTSACGENHALRREVEALLAAHLQDSGFLAKPAPEQLAADRGPETPPTEALAQVRNDDLAFLAPSSKPGHLGRLGHYEVLDVIGKGGFGIVLKAFDEKLHRMVAIKVLSPAIATSATARRRFTREARAAAAVAHEHVVTIHAVDDEHDPPYLVMQCIDGVSLQDKLNAKGPLGLKEILRIGLQTAEGLAAAHKQGHVHRDIKPANILLENGVERVKITDFGLARAVDDASVTQSGMIAGTPMYMSPEQAEGLAVDHRSDLFSLGTVLYVMCTGRLPFRATGTMAILKRVVEETPRPIREINPEIPDWLEAIVAKLHAKKPEERFQTAKEVAELLGQHLAQVQQPSQVALPAMKTPAPMVNEPPTSYTPIPARVWYGAGVGAFGIELFVLAMALWQDVWDLRTALLMGHVLFACVMLALSGLAAVRRTVNPRWSLRMAQAAIFCAVLSAACAVALVGISLTGTFPAVPGHSAWKANDDLFTPLFNGKNLNGWKTHPEQPGSWRVEDGLLVGRSVKPSHLFSARGDYENFHLRVEAKISDRGDSGLLFRCEYGLNGDDKKPAPLGYEANIAFLTEFKTGSLWGAGWPPVGPKESFIVPDTWFTLEVMARENHIVITVNGKTTLDFLDPNDKYRRGHIALQAWATGTVVCFRKIEIKELPLGWPVPVR